MPSITVHAACFQFIPQFINIYTHIKFYVLSIVNLYPYSMRVFFNEITFNYWVIWLVLLWKYNLVSYFLVLAWVFSLKKPNQIRPFLFSVFFFFTFVANKFKLVLLVKILTHFTCDYNIIWNEYSFVIIRKIY